MGPALLLGLLALGADAATQGAERDSPPLLELLQERGLAVLQGPKNARRLAFVSWPAVETAERQAPEALALAKALADLKAGRSLAGRAKEFRTLAAAPARGLVTVPIASLAAALASLPQDPKDWERPEEPLAFEAKWGAELLTRHRADLEDDPAGLVRFWFETRLAGPRAEPEAVRHFLDHFSRLHGADLSSLLERDARAGQPSEDLRARLRQYLSEQRRRLALKRGRDLALALDKKTTLAKDLADTQRLARELLGEPRLADALKARIAKSRADAPKLLSTGLHLQEPVRLGRYELGDEAVLSAAYWVDGLPDGSSASIEETSFVETYEGIAALESRTVARKNGGPYPFTRRVPLSDSRPFWFRSIVSGPSGTVLADALRVDPAADFESVLERLAEADQQASACRFQDADYARVETLAAAGAKEKPQYAALLKAVKERRAKAAKDAAAFARLEELAAASRADASPEQCRYDTKRTEEAIKAAAALPAGCAALVPELDRQLAVIRRRAADQDAYEKAAADARAKLKSCDFARAAEQAARALAILEADPAARCGALAQDAEALAPLVSQARAAALWKEHLQRELEAARANSSPPWRLQALSGVVARADWLQLSSCFNKEARAARGLIKDASAALGGPSAAEALQVLGPDPHLARAEAELLAERRKLESEARELQAKSAEAQAPAPQSERPKIKPKVRPAPPAKPKAKVKKKA